MPIKLEPMSAHERRELQEHIDLVIEIKAYCAQRSFDKGAVYTLLQVESERQENDMRTRREVWALIKTKLEETQV